MSSEATDEAPVPCVIGIGILVFYIYNHVAFATVVHTVSVAFPCTVHINPLVTELVVE